MPGIRSATWLLSATAILLTACGAPAAAPRGDSDRLRILATTTLVGDVVAQIGGEAVDLTVLLPPGADPHAFDPTPQDAAAVAEADIVFVNGLGLETFLDRLLANAGDATEIIAVSDGIKPIDLASGHEEPDPHVWFDPTNVIVWADNVERTLSRRDPPNASTYSSNADGFRAELAALDEWTRAHVSQLDEAERRLVTDHDELGYFARRYGFEVIATIIPTYSTVSEPSAQQLAQVEDAVRAAGTRAIFVGATVNPALAERVAVDTGVQLVPLYTGSLGDAQGPAGTYLDLMHYNVNAIVTALKR